MDKEIRKWKKKHAEAIRASMANPGMYLAIGQLHVELKLTSTCKIVTCCLLVLWLTPFNGSLSSLNLLEEVLVISVN